MINLFGLGTIIRLGIILALFVVFVSLWFDLMLLYGEKHKHQTPKHILTQDQTYIKYYAGLYTKIKHDCALNKKQIVKRYSIIVKEAVKPIPQIEIPHEKDECKALKEMVNEASTYFSK